MTQVVGCDGADDCAGAADGLDGVVPLGRLVGSGATLDAAGLVVGTAVSHASTAAAAMTVRTQTLGFITPQTAILLAP